MDFASIGPQYTPVDLRRRHGSEHAERLVHLASRLPTNDRALLEAVYLHGRSAVEIARLSCLPVRRVRRRIRVLVGRVTDPLYLFVISRQDEWSRTRRRIASAIVINGLSMKQAAVELGLTYYTVRSHAAAIRTMFEVDQGAEQ